MPEEAPGVARFRRSRTVTDLNPEAGEYAVRRYREAQEALGDFDHRYRLMLYRYAPCPLYPRQRLANFGRHVYGLARQDTGRTLLELVARDAARWVTDGAGPGLLARAARLALQVISGTGSDADEQWIQTRIESLLPVGQQSGGNVNEEQKSTPSAEEKLTAAKAREEKVVVKVKLSELRERVRQYLSERLESKEAAELAAQGVVEAFEAKDRASTPKPEAPGNGRGNGHKGLADWGADDTVVSRFRGRRSVEGLKLALAGHQPVVRLVVAERLQGQRPIDEIATKFDLTRDEVLDILSKMRFWVGRFTDSYKDDWYWTDSAQKYIIPEHKLAPKKKGLRLQRS